MLLFEIILGLSLFFQSISGSKAAEKPKITIPPSAVTLHQGQNAVFNCSVSNQTESVVVKWVDPNSTKIRSGGRFLVTNTSLIIINAQKDDSGFYRCMASNSFGTSSAQAELTVLDPPQPIQFTTKPTNATGKEGGSVTFYCKARGFPSPAVKWSKLVGLLPEGRHSFPSTGSLQIVNLQSSDFGFYDCTASNILETLSVSVYLHIKGFPVIIQGPTSVVVSETATVLLTCIITGVPDPTILWATPTGQVYNYTQSLHGAGRIAVLSNHSLLISNVSAWDMGNYTCAAVNEVGRQTAKPARLNVLSKPRFSEQLQNMSKIAGDTVNVECKVIAYPAPTYQWKHADGTVATHSKTLVFTSVGAANEGYYTCFVNNSIGNNRATFYLRIKVPPTFVVQPRDQKVTKGQKASIPCKVQGDPVPVVTWYNRGVLISNSSRYSVSRDGTLSLNHVTYDDNGQYQCVAKNEAGATSANITVFVVDFPKFTTAPNNQTVKENVRVTWPCRAQGPDKPKVTWYLQAENGGQLKNVTSRAIVTDDGDLQFSQVTRLDRGVYVCSACNAAGCRAVQANLDVHYPPSFPVSPAAVGVIEGQDAKLECKPDSSPVAVITWRTPSGTVIPGTSYQQIIHSVRPPDTGFYSCIAENEMGSTSATVQLTIGTKAKILDFAKSNLGANRIQLSCIVDGQPTPLVTWYQGTTALPIHTFPNYKVTSQKELQAPVAAVDGGNISCRATNSHATPMKLAKVPSIPGPFVITNIKSSSVVVTWSQPSALELVIYNTLEFRLADGAPWQVVNVSGTSTSYKITNLRPYSLYALRMKSANGLGQSGYSAHQNVTTNVAAPSTPRNLAVQVLNARMLQIAWLTPLDLNGPDSSLSYSIQAQVGENVTSHVLPHVSGDTHHEYNFTQLRPDTMYTVTVRGRRQLGNGNMLWGPGTQKMGTTLQLVPDTPPPGLVVASNGPNQILVKWKVPPYSVGGYHILYKQFNASEPYVQVNLRASEEHSHLITGLREDTRYTVKARMYSNAGIGPFSAPSVVQTGLGVSAANDAFRSSGKSLGLKVAIAGIVCGLILLLIVLLVVCLRRRKNKRTRKSFKLSLKNRGLKYVIGKPRRSSTRSDSDESASGHYNIGQRVEEEIDMHMFAHGIHSPDAASLATSGAVRMDPSGLDLETPDVQEVPYAQARVRLSSYIPKQSPQVDERHVSVSADVSIDDRANRRQNQREGQESRDRAYSNGVNDRSLYKKHENQRSSGVIENIYEYSEPFNAAISNQSPTERVQDEGDYVERFDESSQNQGLANRTKCGARNGEPYREQISIQEDVVNGSYAEQCNEGLGNSVPQGANIESTKVDNHSSNNEGNNAVIYAQVNLEEKRKSRVLRDSGELQVSESEPIEEQGPDLPPNHRDPIQDINSSSNINPADKLMIDSNGLLDDTSEVKNLEPLPDVISSPRSTDAVKHVQPVVSIMHKEVSPGTKRSRVASWATTDDGGPAGDTGLGRNFFVDM